VRRAGAPEEVHAAGAGDETGVFAGMKVMTDCYVFIAR
jgi:hypothetical protein